ncbi:MAG: hypothetical protein ACOC80_04175 [Petrotogales bacterium]
MRKRDLLLFYSHEKCPARATALPVIAWLSEKHNFDYEGYFSVKPSLADIGDYLPFTGNNHLEQFYYIASFYKNIHLFSLTEDDEIPFERFALKGEGKVIKYNSENLNNFYAELFDFFGERFPKKAVVFPTTEFSFPEERVEIGDFKISGESRIDTFVYPEIFFRRSLGLYYEMDNDKFYQLKNKGVSKLFLIACPENAKDRYVKLGFDVEIIDTLKPQDTYLSFTERISKRWLDKAKGLALGNDPITLRWTPKYLRDRILPIAAVGTLKKAVDALDELTKKLGNRYIWGSQVFDDTLITELSKRDIIFTLAHDIEVGFTIREKLSLPSVWLKRTKNPIKDEYSDKYLKEKIEKGDIPVCFLHYAADLGHLPVLPRYLDLHSIKGIRDGIAFPSSWWEFSEDNLERLYISHEHGGVFPTAEPLICSAGTGVATEAKGYLSEKALLENLLQSKKNIEKYVGEDNVPAGYYSFQDACPSYVHQSGEPQYNVIEKAGFEYAITYKCENEFPRIVYETERLIVLNQQTEHWSFNPMVDLKKWEETLVNSRKKGWIIIGLDSPFWGMVPCYFGLASKGLSLEKVQKAMVYAKNGGTSGRLFLAKPHEVVRYAKILKKY